MKRIVATLLLVVLLLSGGMPAFATGSANPDSAPKQSLGQYQGSAAKPADLVDGKKPVGALQKLSSGLLPLADQAFLPKGVTLGQYQAQMQELGSAKPDKAAPTGKSVNAGALAYVYVKVRESSDLSKLTSYAKIANQKDTMAAAWVNAEKLRELAAQSWVVSVSEVTAPVVNKADTSEGVGFHKANLAHALSTGKGVKIGIISDGANSYKNAQATGDLPSNVTILSDVVGGDEGTAMMEIVYDMAPGAQIYFHDCGTNVLAFNEAVDDLIAAGCTIVVDDIGWILEPFFEDGVIASHFKEIAAKNKVLFVSSAGNAASNHYQGVYTNSTKYNNWHDFSNGTSGNEDLYVSVAPGRSVRVVLQWKEPFGSANLSDYDLYLFTSTGSTYKSANSNSDIQMPMEAIQYTNYGSSTVYINISVYKYSAPNPKELEVYVYGGSMESTNTVKADSIFGHAAVPGVIACGAIDAGKPSNPPTIESFSSQGPVTTLTGKRNKPDVCGADGVNVTGAGGFSDPFFGTSAASPHIGAIAALIKARFPTYTPSQIANAITKNSTDLGAAGFDTVYGYGLANAYAAVNSACSITVKANNTSYGTVSGGGSYTPGAQATVKAIPKAGYRFVRWLEGTTAVSTSAEYKFTVSKSRTLTAEFTKIATPANLKAVSTSYNSIRLTWTAISVAAKYEVYRATSSTGPFIKLPDVSSPSYTGSGLVTGKTYYYKVRAKFIAGSTVTYGGYSAVVPAKAVPATPTAVKVASTTYNSVKLTWAAVAGATKYEVYRATSSTGTYTKLPDVSSASYTGSSLTTGKAYYYKVRAYRLVSGVKHYSGYSAVVKATPLPAAPTSLKAAKASSASVKLTWAAVTGATKYEVYRATSATGTYYKSTETTLLSFVSGNLTKGKTYYFKVRAYRVVGSTKYYGPFSSVVAYKHY